jgi:hypothetical protein
VAAARVDPRQRGKGGLDNRALRKLAHELGLALEPCRSFNLDTDEGVLRVRSASHHRAGHWVAVRWGLVLDPSDGYLAPWRLWTARYQARPGTLLRGTF